MQAFWRVITVAFFGLPLTLHIKPSEAKNVAEPFGKADTQALGTGLELRASEVLGGGLCGGFAEHRQK